MFPRDLFNLARGSVFSLPSFLEGWDSSLEQLDALKGWGKPLHQPRHCNEVGRAPKGPSPCLVKNLTAFISEERGSTLP